MTMLLTSSPWSAVPRTEHSRSCPKQVDLSRSWSEFQNPHQCASGPIMSITFPSIQLHTTVDKTPVLCCEAVIPHLNQVSFLQRLCYHGRTAGSPPTPKDLVPSPDHWKSKCRKDVDLEESLRNNRQSEDLQAWSVRNSRTSTSSVPEALPISSSSQVQLDPTNEVCMILFLVTAGRSDVPCSVANIISTTNSPSRATMAMFFMTHADLNQEAKPSCRSCRTSSFESRRRSG
jgi:hypothetical protein